MILSREARLSAICEAIRTRSLLEFDYDGERRVVAPYCHGISTAGSDVLRAVQVGGASSSGLGFGKLWTIAKMTSLHILNEKFVANDPDYNPNDRAIREIHCRV